MKIVLLLLCVVTCAHAAESIEVRITRTHTYWFFSRTTQETHLVGISGEQTAGVFSFDEGTRFVTNGVEVLPLTPGATTIRTDLDVRKTGGQFIFSRTPAGLTFDLFYRRVAHPAEPTDAALKSTHLSGLVSSDPSQPTVISHVTPSVSKIVLTYRSH